MILTNPCYILAVYILAVYILAVYILAAYIVGYYRYFVFVFLTFVLFCCTDTISQNLDVTNHNDAVDVSSVLSEIPVNPITTLQPTTGKLSPRDM
jgi:hypothetical protein